MIDFDNASFRSEILSVKERVEQFASEPILDTLTFKLLRSLIMSEMAKSPDVEHSKFSIVAVNNEEFAKDSSQAIQMYSEASRNGTIIFLLARDNELSYFINGHNYGALFATAADLALYKRKKTVDELDQVFEDYRNVHITDSNNYQKFFVSLTELKSLHKDLQSNLSVSDFIEANKHLVKNKPES